MLFRNDNQQILYEGGWGAKHDDSEDEDEYIDEDEDDYDDDDGDDNDDDDEDDDHDEIAHDDVGTSFPEYMTCNDNSNITFSLTLAGHDELLCCWTQRSK